MVHMMLFVAHVVSNELMVDIFSLSRQMKRRKDLHDEGDGQDGMYGKFSFGCYENEQAHPLCI